MTDYGLFGVIGGLTAFIVFFNTVLGGSIGRFFAYNIGKASAEGNETVGLEECRKWFSMAVLIHTVLPLTLVLIGYPIGEYAVRHWLVIPVDKVVSCTWVWRFACVSCFVGMVNVPFTAMYSAKQYIAELTIYSVIQTAVNICFVYYMVTHPGFWLTRYALYSCLLMVIPQLIICFRALKVFPECRFRLSYCWSWDRFKELLNYAGWQSFGVCTGIARGQCIALVVNRNFGPNANAAMAVANTVNTQTLTLSAAIQGALVPAITTAYGRGDMELMRRMALRACKFVTMSSLVFILPLTIEMDEVLALWLKTPPQYAAGLCLCMMLAVVFDQLSVGQMIAVNASGKVAFYQFAVGSLLILAFPFAWLLVACGLNLYSVGAALAGSTAVASFVRVSLAKSRVEMSPWIWMRRALVPIFLIVIPSLAVGCLPRVFLEASFIRVVLTTLVVEMVLLPLTWRFVFDSEERHFVCDRLRAVLSKIRGVLNA